MKELLELMLKCENSNYESPFIGMLSLAFKNPKAIKNIYKFKRKFFAIENIGNIFYIVCLPINYIENYTKGNINEIAVVFETNKDTIPLIDEELRNLQMENL